MIKGTRWIYEVTAFNPQTRIATLEHDSRNIRDVSTDEEGKPLDPAWREIVLLPPPPDDDCDDCEEDAFSRPIEPQKVLETPPEFPIDVVSEPRGCATRHHETRVPACVFCRALSL